MISRKTSVMGEIGGRLRWLFQPVSASSRSPIFLRGSLVDPRLRASNEHILIVRVLRARRAPGRSPLIL